MEIPKLQGFVENNQYLQPEGIVDTFLGQLSPKLSLVVLELERVLQILSGLVESVRNENKMTKTIMYQSIKSTLSITMSLLPLYITVAQQQQQLLQTIVNYFLV